MATNYSAQSTITIRRTRTNDGLSLAFRNLGGPLYQFVDSTTGDVGPDWDTTDANRPIIQPQVTSLQGSAVTTVGGTWYYNGLPLAFNGATEGDYVKTADGVFGVKPDMTLKIFKNVASSSNIASDNLSLELQVRVLGVEYNLNGQVTISIQSGGSSAYFAVIDADNGPQLSKDVASTTLGLRLFLGALQQALPGTYAIEWWKDNVELTAAANSPTLTVGRDDVDGAQLYIAYVKTGGNTVAAAAIVVDDLADEYQVQMRIVSGTDVSDGNSVVVEASLKNIATNTLYTSANSTGIAFNWTLSVYRATDSDYTAIRTITSTDAQPQITITTADTDAGSVLCDVDVLAEVAITIS